MSQDLEHLKILTIFHYVAAGMIALFACIPMIHFFLGLAMATGALGSEGGPESIVGIFFMAGAGLFIIAGWTLAVLVFFAGRNLSRRTNHTFCMIIAGLECLFMPVGTVLGVFTIIVLARNSVKALFGQHVPDTPQTGAVEG